MKRKAGKWDTLDAVLAEIWTMLETGVKRFNDPFHWPVLSTSAEDGPRSRAVILRQVSRAERLLVCHTDARASKAGEISACPDVSWLFYHPKRKVQLRITGQATLHRDDQFADEQWAKTRLTSRINYCSIEPPGTIVEKPSTGLPDFLRNKVPTLLESERGRKNFLAIACRIDSIDWLVLRLAGNRRARFKWDNDMMNAAWLIP
jgi:hypothetical protein